MPGSQPLPSPGAEPGALCRRTFLGLVPSQLHGEAVGWRGHEPPSEATATATQRHRWCYLVQQGSSRESRAGRAGAAALTERTRRGCGGGGSPAELPATPSCPVPPHGRCASSPSRMGERLEHPPPPPRPPGHAGNWGSCGVTRCAARRGCGADTSGGSAPPAAVRLEPARTSSAGQKIPPQREEAVLAAPGCACLTHKHTHSCACPLLLAHPARDSRVTAATRTLLGPWMLSREVPAHPSKATPNSTPSITPRASQERETTRQYTINISFIDV